MDNADKRYEIDLNKVDDTCNIIDMEQETEPNSNDVGDDTQMIGRIFKSVDEAHQFYNAYARIVGFSIRKHWESKNKADKKVLTSTFCCSCQGEREKHIRGMPVKPRALTRTGCMTQFQIKLDESENYSVVKFVNEHNHKLAPQDKVHHLRSQRKIQPAQVRLIDNMHSADFGSAEIFSYLSVEAGGTQNLNFIQEDCDNYMQKKRVEVFKKGDARLLLEYFKDKQKENKSFFYSIQVDEDNQISNYFWCDAKSRVDYDIFGDVVGFDTTFKTNGYDMPFAPIVGVNNHGQTILFGCALLMDETTSSFKWLFETFLNTMGGKEMKTIFSDQAAAIANAIKEVFPNTHHRLCLWHIYQNALKHLSNVFTTYKSFSYDFGKCVYDNETEDEFQSCWEHLLEKYELGENEWLKNLYQIREKWAQVYGREHFCAGMTTTQRSESINSYFKRYFKRKQTFLEFVHQYDKAVARRREKEVKADFKSITTKPNLVSAWTVELKAAEIYTRKAFNVFQQEFKKLIDLESTQDSADGITSVFTIKSYDGHRPRIVSLTFSNLTVKCSCKKFEFSGLLCAHALKVLRMLNLLDLPPQYYLKRWTKDAKVGVFLDDHGEQINVNCDPTLTTRYSELSHLALSIATKGCESAELCFIAKRVLLQSLDEVKSYIESHRVAHSASINNLHVEKNHQDLLRENITIRAPPRKKVRDEVAGRIKSGLEKKKKPHKHQPQGTKKDTAKIRRASNNSVHQKFSNNLRAPITTEGLKRAEIAEPLTCWPISGVRDPHVQATNQPKFPARKLTFLDPSPSYGREDLSLIHDQLED